MNVKKYMKFLTALAGGAATILTIVASVNKWVQAALPLITALSVYQVPNKER